MTDRRDKIDKNFYKRIFVQTNTFCNIYCLYRVYNVHSTISKTNWTAPKSQLQKSTTYNFQFTRHRFCTRTPLSSLITPIPTPSSYPWKLGQKTISPPTIVSLPSTSSRNNSAARAPINKDISQSARARSCALTNAPFSPDDDDNEQKNNLRRAVVGCAIHPRARGENNRPLTIASPDKSLDARARPAWR